MDDLNDDPLWTPFTLPARNTCEHEFSGWREFPDGLGGEQVCKKCGLGALAYSLWSV